MLFQTSGIERTRDYTISCGPLASAPHILWAGRPISRTSSGLGFVLVQIEAVPDLFGSRSRPRYLRG